MWRQYSIRDDIDDARRLASRPHRVYVAGQCDLLDAADLDPRILTGEPTSTPSTDS
jgi:hypothetical protein